MNHEINMQTLYNSIYSLVLVLELVPSGVVVVVVVVVVASVVTSGVVVPEAVHEHELQCSCCESDTAK